MVEYSTGRRVDYEGKEHLVLGAKEDNLAMINGCGKIIHAGAKSVQSKRQTCFFRAKTQVVRVSEQHHDVRISGGFGTILGTVEGLFVLASGVDYFIVSPEDVEYDATSRAEVDLKKCRETESDRCGVTCHTEKCEICGSQGECLHHRTYVRHGFEKRSDYAVLCANCHDMIHMSIGKLFYDPEKMYSHMAATLAEKMGRFWYCPYGFNAAAMPDIGVQISLVYKLAESFSKDFRFTSWSDDLYRFAESNLERVRDAGFFDEIDFEFVPRCLKSNGWGANVQC